MQHKTHLQDTDNGRMVIMKGTGWLEDIFTDTYSIEQNGVFISCSRHTGKHIP